jgi:nucleoid-associated protein YgaU
MFSHKNPKEVIKSLPDKEQLLIQETKIDNLPKGRHNQSIKLKDLFKVSLEKTNSKDKKYIDDLSKIEKFKTHSKKSSAKIAQTDYYNKVRISLSQGDKDYQIQHKINQLIEQHTVKKEDNYIKTLGKESKIRKNEVRSIVLKKGESLWSLARRAYGKGALYTKILEANPQITQKNIRRLQLGTVIRVPL